LWVVLIWVSKNTIQSHKDFIEKQDLQVDLISDSDLILHKELWAYWEKNNYWKIVTWVIRSTFLFNQTWEVIQEWRNVRAKGHAEKVLREIQIP
jgi:peroxiredoxin Q/BCP